MPRAEPQHVLSVVIGTVAATLTIISFVPQAWKVIKTRDTHGLAKSMWLLSTTAFALWTVYGIVLGKLPIIIPNAICFLLAGFILTMKVLPRRKRDKVADVVAEAIAPNH